jgi:lipoprotein-anchoring transpeptidase ErfK/SrfK
MMVRKTNRKRKPKGESRTPAVIFVGIGALALSAFGLWRCLEEPEVAEAEAPQLRAAAVQAVDVGPGAEVDPTIVGEASLLEQEMPIPGPEEIAAQEAPAEPAPPAAAIDAAGTAAAADVARAQEEAEKRFPLHAVAFHFHSQIFAEPKAGARVIAYARRGSQLRVGQRASTDGCKKGWHEVSGGGFVCDGQGIDVSTEPVTFAPSPPAPDLGAPLPYAYKYAVADAVPEYWRIPTPEEAAAAAKAIARLDEAAATGPDGEAHDAEALRAVLARAASIAIADGGAEEAPGPAPLPSAEADAGEEDGLPAYVHQRMVKGFYVSTDDTVTENGVTYARTVRGRFVPDDRLARAKTSAFEGILVDERRPLPLAFVVAGGTKMLARKGNAGALREAGAVSRYHHFAVLEEIAYKGQKYVRVGDATFLPARAVAVARAATPPPDLQPGERWIDVDLSEQTLVAYEGEAPVFATLVSTGRPGHETPTGAFRIYGKHVTITMDDTLAGDEAYSIEDVPWTQYFREGYALHAAFWHDKFGRVRSHGCVNLSPSDARRLFFWTGPQVAAGLHGTVATRANPGTRVIIHT